MSHTRGGDDLGQCPRCGTPIGPVDVLITYGESDDERHFADCPGCRDVVHPVARDGE